MNSSSLSLSDAAVHKLTFNRAGVGGSSCAGAFGGGAPAAGRWGAGRRVVGSSSGGGIDGNGGVNNC